MACSRANNSLAMSIPGQGPLEKLLYPCVAEYSVTGRMRRETCRSICKLYYTATWSKTQAGLKHQQTGMARAKHKSSPVNRRGRSVANIIQGWGAKQREIIQIHGNSPGRGRQSPNDKEREKSKACYKD